MPHTLDPRLRGDDAGNVILCWIVTIINLCLTSVWRATAVVILAYYVNWMGQNSAGTLLLLVPTLCVGMLTAVKTLGLTRRLNRVVLRLATSIGS